VAVLERELGVSPLPETRAAYQAALHGQLTMEPPAPPVTLAALPSWQVPLIGREEALGQLARALDRARAGQGVAVLISGEAGVGKSRLAQEFLAGLGGRALVAAGSGHQAERGLPYWPLIEALRPYAAAIARFLCAAGPHYLAEAARLLPELRTACPGLPAPAPPEPGQAQGRLFEALAHCLRCWAVTRPPLVLCLDDLHWADEATLTWLGYLARHIRDAPILVLGAYRTEEGGRVTALRDAWARAGIVQEISLPGLALPDVLRLIRRLSGQTSGAERFSQRLHLASGGNPFYLLETLAALFEAGALRQEATGWSTASDATTEDYRELPLPDGLTQTIRERLSRLTPQARQVLETAAVIGHRFAFDLALKTSGRREVEVVDALDELAARHVISGENGSHRFRHDLLRAVVYRDLSYGRRRLLHRRAAEALARLKPDDAASLAWHFERAEAWRLAAEQALRASQAAKALFAYVEARGYCNRALVFLDHDAAGLRDPQEIVVNRRLRIQALHERGWVLRLLGEMDAYAADSAELAGLAELLGDPRTSAQAHWRQAHAQRWFCRYRAALAAAETGVRLSRAAGDAVLEAICLRELGLAHRELGQCEPARVALERALALFAAAGQAEYEIHMLGNLSTLHLRCGDPAGALALAQRSLARCEEADLALTRRLPLGDLGAAAVELGDYAAARRWLEESLAISRQVADRTQEILALGHLGWLAVKLGHPAAALAHLRDALALAEAIDSRGEQSWLHAGLAEACRLAGAADQALLQAKRALELAQAHGRPYDERLARTVLAGLATSA